MVDSYIEVEHCGPLSGEVSLVGAKNAVLVIMASLLLTNGKSRLANVPASADVLHMITILEELGAEILFVRDEHVLEVDTSPIKRWRVRAELMKKMRASVLVMGPLLARFGKAEIAMTGGCVLGARPIDYHLKNFEKMGVTVQQDGDFINAHVSTLKAIKIVLDYPSVGATENLMMAATLTPGTTRIINAALEPEVIDLITVLKKMGAQITILPPAIIEITGVATLYPITHAIMVDRLEAGALLCAAAITGGSLSIPNANPDSLDLFLYKLEEMGHCIQTTPGKDGITFRATKTPRAVSFKTGPYPQFPTDLQAPMMALQTVAAGTSVIEETVFENRLVHVRELQKMGAQIKVSHMTATIIGVENLYATHVIAPDIRASCALVLAGSVAQGTTVMTGIHHWQRAYEAFELKLNKLGACISIKTGELPLKFSHQSGLQQSYAP